MFNKGPAYVVVTGALIVFLLWLPTGPISIVSAWPFWLRPAVTLMVLGIMTGYCVWYLKRFL